MAFVQDRLQSRGSGWSRTSSACPGPGRFAHACSYECHLLLVAVGQRGHENGKHLLPPFVEQRLTRGVEVFGDLVRSGLLLFVDLGHDAAVPGVDRLADLPHFKVEQVGSRGGQSPISGTCAVWATRSLVLMVAPTSLAAWARLFSACALSASSLVLRASNWGNCCSRKSSTRCVLYSSNIGACAGLRSPPGRRRSLRRSTHLRSGSRLGAEGQAQQFGSVRKSGSTAFCGT